MATRYIPDQLGSDIKVFNFLFPIKGTLSKNYNPSQTSPFR